MNVNTTDATCVFIENLGEAVFPQCGNQEPVTDSRDAVFFFSYPPKLHNEKATFLFCTKFSIVSHVKT